ncbi:MAG: double zinc ribbon domain-containing protein [Desulfobaccales bacterium]
MTACPYCQEPVEGNALFCRSCGASLRIPEYDRAFCPHCGARVSSRQEFCHECNWSLVKAATVEKAPSPAPPLVTPAKPKPWKNPWVWGLLVFAGLAIAALPWLFISGAPAPAPPPPLAVKVAPEKPVPSAPAPVAPLAAVPSAVKGGVPPVTGTPPLSVAVLRDQLADLLNQLKEAQLKKDISRYSQTFSPDFPDFDKRRQKTLAVWDAYDYSSLDFELTDIQPLDAGHALAQVTWTFNILQKKTQTSKSESQTYKVWFSKDEGRWRINNLEIVRKSG